MASTGDWWGEKLRSAAEAIGRWAVIRRPPTHARPPPICHSSLGAEGIRSNFANIPASVVPGALASLGRHDAGVLPTLSTAPMWFRRGPLISPRGACAGWAVAEKGERIRVVP